MLNNLRQEIKIIIIYLIFGSLWILFSDRIILSLLERQDNINQIQTYKGWIFVAITGIIFYNLFKNALDELREKREELQASYEQLEADNEEFKALNDELKDSYKEIHSLVNNLEKMITITSSLSNLSNLKEDHFLGRLLRTALELVPETNKGLIAKKKNNENIIVDSIGLKEPGKVKNIIDSNDFLQDLPSVCTLRELEEKNKKDIFPDHIQEVIEYDYSQLNDILMVNLNRDGNLIGHLGLFLDKKTPTSFSNKSRRIMNAFYSLANAYFTFKEYNRIKEGFQKELISSITSMLEIHDVYTEGHSQQVANLSSEIAARLKLSKEEIDKAYWSGMVHDIGKILIPTNILNKKGALSKEEFRQIKKHTIWGYRTLNDSKRLTDIALYVRHHHERWDGRGYPDGLSGNEIPLISRIICLADAWDAMRSQRPYRQPLTPEKAVNEIKNNKGTQFCPRVSEAFLSLYEEKMD
ncbi:MAG: HD domain-containing phosphohydrolase [Halanaerobiales bacterium]